MAVVMATKEKNILSGIKNVGGLLRISTEKTDNTGKKVNLEKTLKNHKEKMTNFLGEKKWNYELFEEVISGGKNYEDRPELKRLIANIDKFDAIVVMELVRLSRQGLSSQIIKEEVKKRGILIITLNPFKVYDMKNPQDSFLYDLSISMGEYEKMLVSLRVKQNKISMAHQGLNSSGSVPFGYIRNPKTKKLEIETVKDEHGNEVESEKASIVRMIYQWYLDGIGQRSICDRLNDMGIKNNNGNKWIPNSLRYLLTCPTYKGTLIANYLENEKGRMVATETVEKNENHPAIIDPEIWEKAQAIRLNKKERSGIDKRSKDWNSKKHLSILDGLVFCASCGRKSTIKWYEKKQKFYIIKCTRFDAKGMVCHNGGNGADEVAKIVFEKIEEYKTEIEKRMAMFESNDFGFRLTELEEEKSLYEKSLEKLKVEMKVIDRLEMKYEMEKEISGFEDKDKEEMIAENKRENQEKRQAMMLKLEAIYKQLDETPSADGEIKKLNEKIEIIKELETNKDLTIHQVNAMLKEIILKVHYKRELPTNYKTLKKVEKEKFISEIEIQYLD